MARAYNYVKAEAGESQEIGGQHGLHNKTIWSQIKQQLKNSFRSKIDLSYFLAQTALLSSATSPLAYTSTAARPAFFLTSLYLGSAVPHTCKPNTQSLRY